MTEGAYEHGGSISYRLLITTPLNVDQRKRVQWWTEDERADGAGVHYSAGVASDVPFSAPGGTITYHAARHLTTPDQLYAQLVEATGLDISTRTWRLSPTDAEVFDAIMARAEGVRT